MPPRAVFEAFSAVQNSKTTHRSATRFFGERSQRVDPVPNAIYIVLEIPGWPLERLEHSPTLAAVCGGTVHLPGMRFALGTKPIFPLSQSAIRNILENFLFSVLHLRKCHVLVLRA